MLLGTALTLLLGITACKDAANSSKTTSEADPPAVRDGGEPVADAAERTILFLGNSLTAGLGVEPEEAFPALIQDRIDSLGWPFRAVNAGLSGETSAGGLRRADWLLRQPVDVLVLELGANDGLRGISTEDTRRNLQGIIDLTRERNPEVEIVLAGMQIPPNMGPGYARSFRTLFPELAEENDAALIPFLLDGVGGVPELNQGDGIHPTAQGHHILARNVWDTLRPVLEQMLEPAA